MTPRPVIRAVFEMPDGSTLTRDWSMAEVEADGKPFDEGSPEWLESPRRSWPDPQGPIIFSGRVRKGQEQEARAVAGENR